MFSIHVKLIFWWGRGIGVECMASHLLGALPLEPCPIPFCFRNFSYRASLYAQVELGSSYLHCPCSWDDKRELPYLALLVEMGSGELFVPVDLEKEFSRSLPPE
jgi:hypothetical protein